MHPILVEKCLFSLQEFLKGKRTYERLKELEQSQWLSAKEIEELQFRRLKEHLEFAYQQVPYYRRLFDEHGLQPHRIDALADFARVPFLTRDILRKEFDGLQPATKPSGVQRMRSEEHTSELQSPCN